MQSSFLLATLELIVFTMLTGVSPNQFTAEVESWSRKLAFPDGANLVIVAEFEMPFLQLHKPTTTPSAIESKFRIELPFKVDLGILGNQYLQLFEAAELPFLRGNDQQPWWSKYSSEEKKWRNRQRRSTKFSSSNGRFEIFGKLENVLTSIGLPGRQCLLRTICEVHEFPNWNAYGFFGEIFPTLFRIGDGSKQNLDNIFYDYWEAQQNGQGNDCFKYTTECGKSLFTNSTRRTFNQP